MKYWCLFIGLLASWLAIPTHSWGAVAFDIADQNASFGGTTVTTSGGKTPTGSNRATIITLTLHTNTVTGIICTFGGVTASPISGTDTTTTRTDRIAMFVATNPAASPTDAVCTWTGASDAVIGYVSANGVDQAVPALHGTFVSSASATTLPITVTSAVSNMTTTTTVNYGNTTSTDKTQRWAQYAAYKGDSAAGAASVTHTWTSNIAGQFVVSGAEFVQVGGAGSGTDTGLGENIYVGQSTAGSDTGADCANQHSAAWFNSGANWGESVGSINRGDVVHLCGTITSTLTVNGSGSTGSMITILWETGAKLSQAVCALSTGCMKTNSKAYLLINGGTNGIIESTANGTGLANQLGSIGILATACANCEIKNINFNNLYVHTNDAPGLADVTVIYSDVNAIRYTGSALLIHDNTIHDTGWAIYNPWTNGDTGTSVYNNTIYNSSHGVTLGGFGANQLTNTLIYNNNIRDYRNWDTTANVYHHDGIHIYGTSGAYATGIKIYNNLLSGDCGAHMTGHIFDEGTADASATFSDHMIFNNVMTCSNTEAVNGILWMGNGTGHQIYNNTIIGGGTSSICAKLQGPALVKFKNNLMTECNFLMYVYGPPTSFTNIATDLNYNGYGKAYGNNWYWDPTTAFIGVFATWKSTCGCDANSFYNAGGLSLSVIGFPLAGSSAIGVGTNLSSVGVTALNSDKFGVVRATIWDMGAYVFPIGGSSGGPASERTSASTRTPIGIDRTPIGRDRTLR